MDKLQSMKAFVEVVNHSGFAAAGRHMNLSRSVVNKMVLHLEADLGVPLLQRTTRRVSPTDAGRAFYERCLNILAEVDAAEQAISQIHTEPKGTLRINAPMSFGTMHLSPALAAFMSQYPDLQVQLTLSDRFIDLVEEGFDVTVRVAAFDPDDTSLTRHLLAPIPRVLCASPAYLGTRGIPKYPGDLHGHDCLHYGHLATGSQWRLIDADGKQQSVLIRSRYCSNNGEALRDAAIQGVGIALLPTFMLQEAFNQKALQPIMTDYTSPSISAFVAYLPNRHLSTKVKVLTAFLQTWFRAPEWLR